MICLNLTIFESDAKPIMKRSDEIRCTTNYEKFVQMGSENFQKRYYAYPIMDKCLKLYADSDFIKKHLTELLKPINDSTNSYSKILTTFKIGSGKFLTKFTICSEIHSKINSVLIASDKETVVGIAKRSSSESCPSFWVVIRANDPSNTLFSWFYDDISNFKTVRKML